MRFPSLILLGAIFLQLAKPQIVMAEDAGEWKSAATSVLITPTQSMWMAGYAGRKGPSEGVLTDLYAKILAIQDPQGTRVVLVTCDLISIPKVLRDVVIAECKSKFMLDGSSVMLNCSHTHCGPVVRDNVEMSVMYPLDAEHARRVETYFIELKDKLVAGIGEAVAKMEPAKLSYSFARCGFAMNRRLPNQGSFTNSPYPQGPVDHEVPILRVASLDGKLRAIAFGYACHNTSTALNQFNADYAGYAQAEIERAHPGVIALFVMGCGGDQNPYPRGKIEQAQAHGLSLATAVEAALLPEPTPIVGKLQFIYEEIELPFAPITRDEILQRKESPDPFERRRSEALLQELESNGKIRTTYPFPIQVVRFGEQLTMITLGGEVVVDYSLRFKKAFPGSNIWVAGYSNDVMAYIPSERVLREGGYEGGGAMRYSNLPNPWRSGVEDRIFAAVSGMVAKLNGEVQ